MLFMVSHFLKSHLQVYEQGLGICKLIVIDVKKINVDLNT